MKAYKKQEMNYRQGQPLPYQCYKPKKLPSCLPTYQFKLPTPPTGVTYISLPPRIVNGEIDESAFYQMPNNNQQQCFSQQFSNVMEKNEHQNSQPIIVNKPIEYKWKTYGRNNEE